MNAAEPDARSEWLRGVAARRHERRAFWWLMGSFVSIPVAVVTAYELALHDYVWFVTAVPCASLVLAWLTVIYRGIAVFRFRCPRCGERAFIDAWAASFGFFLHPTRCVHCGYDGK